MNQKTIVVSEETVRRWIRKLLSETGTVPEDGMPIRAKRRHVDEADGQRKDPKTRMRPYQGAGEERGDKAKSRGPKAAKPRDEAPPEHFKDVASAMGWKDPGRPEPKQGEWQHGSGGLKWKIGKNPATDAPVVRVTDDGSGKTYEIDPEENPDYPHTDVYGRPIQWQVSAHQVEKIWAQAVDRLQLAMGHPGEMDAKGNYIDPEGSMEETQNPDLVMQVMEFAAEEYKEHLEFPARIIRFCAKNFYVPDMEKGHDRFNLGAGEPAPDEEGAEDEDLGITPEEKGSESFSARIVATPRFQKYFGRWLMALHSVPADSAGIKQLFAKDPATGKFAASANQDILARKLLGAGATKPPAGVEKIKHYLGEHPGGPGKGKGEGSDEDAPHKRALPTEGKTLWFRSLFFLADKVGTIDVYNREPGTINPGLRLGLKLSYDPELTKVDQALIFEDMGFKYFLAGQGGAKVHYLDWLRNVAEELGRYHGEF